MSQHPLSAWAVYTKKTLCNIPPPSKTERKILLCPLPYSLGETTTTTTDSLPLAFASMSGHLVQRNLHFETFRKGMKSPGPRSQLYQHPWKLPPGRAHCDVGHPWPSGDGDLPEPDLQLAFWDKDPEITVATRPTCLTAPNTSPHVTPCQTPLFTTPISTQKWKKQIHVFTSTIPAVPIYLNGSECQESQDFFSLRLEVS